MQLIPWTTLLMYQAISMVLVFAASMLICWAWEEAMKNSDIEDLFKGKATFEMLSIVIGFTYVSVVRAMLTALKEQSAFFAKIKLIILKSKSDISRKTLELAMHIGDDHLKIENAHQAMVTLPDDLKEIYSSFFTQETVETGSFFNWSGPYLALGVYFLAHPPLVYTDDSFYDWSIVYSACITILFSFIVTLWYIEGFVLGKRQKTEILKFAERLQNHGHADTHVEIDTDFNRMRTRTRFRRNVRMGLLL